ncbi:MAG: hypothetical protein SVX43_19850, partial [Cyanobacteriota bacterium]|nr:hypothetical protein [Cyanobacteriota bacterium]
IAEQNPQSNLEFLKTFGESSQAKLDALKTDSQTFSVGLKPLENFITTIQGIIEIEKTKNERNLNTTVAIASVGISTASLAATTFTFEQAKGIVAAISPIPANQPPPPSHLWASFGLAFGLSVAIGLLSAAITKYALDRRHR